MRGAPRFLTLLMTAVVVLAAGAPALAHTSARPAAVTLPTAPLNEALAAAAPDAGVPVAALALLAAVGLAALSRQRRAVAVTLVLVVALLAFETGIHSTHHLGTGNDSSRCAVAWMSAQLSADVVDLSVDALPAPAPQASIPVLAAPAPTERAVAPDAGRGPPVLSA